MGANKQILSEKYNADEDADPATVMVVDLPPHENCQVYVDDMYRAEKANVPPPDILVIRTGVDRQVTNVADELERLTPFKERYSHADLYLLYSNDYQHEMAFFGGGPGGDPRVELDSGRFLLWLQTHEVQEHLRQSDALLTLSENFLFQCPSGVFSRAFVRVGNMQTSRRAMDAVFFWLIPHLKGVSTVLTETWTISSIALNCARLLARYDKPRFEANPDSGPHVEMISEYLGSPRIKHGQVERVLRDACGQGKFNVLVVYSMTRTGRSVKKLQGLIDGLDGYSEHFSIVSLFSVQPAAGFDDIQTLCDLGGAMGKTSLASVDGPEGRSVVEIDSVSFFPHTIKEDPLNLGPQHSVYQSFFNTYKGTGALSVHRDAMENTRYYRHHAIYVDVERMLETAAFKKNLDDEISKIEQAPSLIFRPPHDAAETLSAYVCGKLSERFKNTPEVTVKKDLSHNLLGGDVEEKLRNLGKEDLVLVVDDVSVTGARLKRYQRGFRDAGYKGQICYLIGVARAANQEDWKQRKIELKKNAVNKARPHLLLAVEEVLLPDWDKLDCPWCEEYKVLSGFTAGRYMEEDHISDACFTQVCERQDLLKGNSGLMDNAFWRISEEPALQLRNNSIFMEHDSASDADVIACICSAVQGLRDESGTGLGLRYPELRIIDLRSFMGERFNENVIRVGLARAVRREDILPEKRESVQNLQQAVQQYFEDGDPKDPKYSVPEQEHHAVRLELLIAYARDVLLKPDAPFNEDVLSACQEYRDFIDYVLAT